MVVPHVNLEPVARHHPVSIHGINVQFPFKPYETQREYMKSVIEAITKKNNALLESPTGTGKTLSLLCASLAWLSNNTDKSTIYYTSRTHAQLGQVAKEQKKTAYSAVPSVVLGSRAQTCLNEDVRRQSSEHLINRSCRNAIVKNACAYYSNYDQKLETLDTNQVLDIETLGEWGRKHQCCSYYAGKKLAETKASLVMMPYNYLLDPSLSKGFPLRLEKSVIIIDEAHNVDAVLKEAVSAKFTMTCLKTIIDSCNDLPSKLSDALNRELHGLTRYGYDPMLKRGGKAISNEFEIEKKTSKKKEKESEKESKPNLIEELANKLTNERLQLVINCVRIIQNETRNIVDMEKINNMDRIFKLFESSGIGFSTSSTILETLDSMISFWSVAGVMSPTLVARYVTATQNFQHFVSIIYPEQCMSIASLQVHRKKLDDYYVVYLEGTYEKGKVVKNYKGGELKDWTLNIWCLHPAIGLRRAIDANSMNGPKSIILTSGTLAPMEPILKELDTEFKVMRQFKHVIEMNQFKVMIIGESPDCYKLTSNYESTEKDEYKKAIGKTLLALFRILPHGTLVFFSSYALMDKVIRYWKERSTIWNEMTTTTSIFIESKGQESFSADMHNFKKRLEAKNTRAVFFGICRGKLSEGINLDGNQCRTVIMTGLPFPSSLDPKILSTKDFQSKRNKDGGNRWYIQQMTRALNQTVGRVIRSKDDYGMLLLCDPRFSSYKYSLSEWTRPFFPAAQTRVRDVEKGIKEFFLEHGDQIQGTFSESVGAFELGFGSKSGSSQSSGTVAVRAETINIDEIKSSQKVEDGPTASEIQERQNRVDAIKRRVNEKKLQQKLQQNTQQKTNTNPAPATTNQSKNNQHQQDAPLRKKFKNIPHGDNNANGSFNDGSFQHYSILDQFKDKNRPSNYKCFICLNEAKNPHKTNCSCARVGCLSELRMLDKKVCGKCGIELRLKDFKQCLFKSAFYPQERQPILFCKGKKRNEG